LHKDESLMNLNTPRDPDAIRPGAVIGSSKFSKYTNKDDFRRDD